MLAYFRSIFSIYLRVFSLDVDGYIFLKNQLEFMKAVSRYQYSTLTLFNYDEVVGDKYKLSKEIHISL